VDEFNRTWAEYEAGFGSCSSNYWLGLEAIAALTAGKDQELRIELEDWAGEKRFAQYDNFYISGASDFYRLSVGGFSGGNAGDSLINPNVMTGVHNGMRFSTPDKDNDNWPDNCASFYSSGWWFNACYWANLNGLYRNSGKGLDWDSWKKNLKSEMKIRDKEYFKS